MFIPIFAYSFSNNTSSIKVVGSKQHDVIIIMFDHPCIMYR